MKSILTVIGTRPEAIKLAPFLSAVHKSTRLKSQVCVTSQHSDLLDPFLQQLNIQTHYRFEEARYRDQKVGILHHNAAHIIKQFATILAESKPDLVVVQGDTTTAFAGALSAFYARIPVAHVEAGLRTGQLNSPWPEEGHRSLIDRLATYFFAPTEQAKEILISEGISSEKIWVVGNTSMDAIRQARKPLQASVKSKNIVVTMHRRENQGETVKEICLAIRSISQKFLDVKIQFVLHPALRRNVIDELSGVANIDLIEPMDHASFIRLLDESLFVITDSGGIQEEAPYMGKPVVVIRNTTERPEGIHAGTALLAGTQSSAIIACCTQLLENEEVLNAMSKVHFPYGDGYTAEKIVTILESELR